MKCPLHPEKGSLGHLINHEEDKPADDFLLQRKIVNTSGPAMCMYIQLGCSNGL